MNHAIPDRATARRCVDALTDYLATKDDSPRAAADLRESVRLLTERPDEDYQEGDRLRRMMAERERLLEGLLRECEWAGRIWTDVEVCPICFAAKDGLPATGKDAKQEPLTHRQDCRLREALGAGNGSAGLGEAVIAVDARTDDARVNRAAEIESGYGLWRARERGNK